MIELLAPAGDFEKLKTALHFGADAVYLAGKNYGLRAFAANFDDSGLKEAIEFTHKQGKKVYVTINIFAKNEDFDDLKNYLDFLREIKADAIIASDPGIIEFIKKKSDLNIHLSTQANTTNKYSAKFWSQFAQRIVLARELNLVEIKEIHDFLPNLDLEAFVHGAMCISFSGRCLLSDYITGRGANRGMCVQSCRWQYFPVDSPAGEIEIQEDKRGSYIMSSKDLNMIRHIDKLVSSGITSFKIEGRAKSPYYVAGVVNAYRRAIDLHNDGKKFDEFLSDDLEKIGNRGYSTGFYFGKSEQNITTSKAAQSYDFMALVLEKTNEGIIIEQRNRFKIGDCLEVLSPGKANNARLEITKMFSTDGTLISDARRVQQKIFIPTDLEIEAGDILRKRI